MSIKSKLKVRKKRRSLRTRDKIKKKSDIRVSVFRSLKNIYGQIIDDLNKVTLAGFSSLQLEDISGEKKKIAREVGKRLGEIAREKGIEKAAFDRGSYLYHGRIKEFAEGLRESGLEL